MATKINTGNPLLNRYPPNNRFINGDFNKQKAYALEKEQFGESITDKESYRLSLSSKRGAIGSGSSSTGAYMFPDGKYSFDKDFSHVMRKDLSIVEIDEYIENAKAAQKNADKQLQAEIQEQIDKALTARENLSKADSNSDTSE